MSDQLIRIILFIILGVAVDFSLTCTADRVATITTEADDINGDNDFNSADAVDRPADWAQNVLNLDFFSDSGFTTTLVDNIVPFGETVYAQITTNVALKILSHVSQIAGQQKHLTVHQHQNLI